MKIWPWSRFDEYEQAFEERSNLSEERLRNLSSALTKVNVLQEVSARWKKRYLGTAELLSTERCAHTALREEHAKKAAGFDYLTRDNARLESDLDQMKLELRQLVEKYNLASMAAQQRQVTIPRDIFDEDPRQPTMYVDQPGATVDEIHDKIETAHSWRHGLSAADKE